MSASEWEHVRLTHNLGARYFAQRILRGKQLFWTNDNLFGWTTTGVRRGDVVCIFSGAPVLHVIRPEESDDGTERWRFVGDAYVHGLMYGAADDIDVEEREFCLV